ncbi:MAG: RluA family pseudouridine synthase, partial [Patescibacteria group bacterium]|nr:RluA family pseudouridine synthase [Patescibacteria group bacterium]
MKNFIIKKEDVNKRLDKFLTENLSNFSRSKLQKMIKAGDISVNGNKASVHYFLREGDEIISQKPKVKSQKLEVKSNKGDDMVKNYNNIKVEDIIIHKEKDFFVVNKPAGILVHPTDKKESDTLVNLLVKKYPALKKIGEDENRPGIVHRLDRYVSGLMVVARSQKMFFLLKDQFKNRKVKKEYIALVYGNVGNHQGVIDFPIARSKESGKMAARAKSADLAKDEKEAFTEYELIKNIKNYSLLKVSIKTGRTHQIRVHINAFGYPVVGDKIYLPKKFRRPRKWQGFDRLFLHSIKLGFEDLKGDWREFESKMSKELEEFIERI